MDWPAAVPILPVISCWSIYAIGSSARAFSTVTNPISAAWPTANRALAVPFVVPGNYPVRALWWVNGGTVAGNVDCGIYTESGALLTSTGSTAQASANAAQSVTLGTPVLLTAGKYNMALVLSSGSGTTFSNNSAGGLAMSGLTQMASAFALPATFTPAAPASSYVPLFGIASRTTI